MEDLLQYFDVDGSFQVLLMTCARRAESQNEKMSHMQLSCNIWGWNYNSKWFPASVYFCMKILLFKPLVI